jgi:RNA polymerase sigma factor (sigma-70 family)
MVEKLLSAAGAPDDAWADFVREYSALLLHVARRTSASRDDAMDAYAYLLERLSEDRHRRLRSYAVDPNSKFTTWLVVVARRICIDYQRSKYGRVRDKGSTEERDRISRRRRLEHLDDRSIESKEIADDSAHPDREVEVAELSAELAAALSMLPAADQLLIRLRFEDGHSAAEIAQALRYPSQFHVYRRINSILAELQTSLRKRGIESAVS